MYYLIDTSKTTHPINDVGQVVSKHKRAINALRFSEFMVLKKRMSPQDVKIIQMPEDVELNKGQILKIDDPYVSFNHKEMVSADMEEILLG